MLGAWDAVTRRLTMVADTTVVNAETTCALLRAVAARGPAGPVTMMLDNARYQRNQVVMALAAGLKIDLLYPERSRRAAVVQPEPDPSTPLRVIERLWRFAKRRACYGKHHADFAGVRSAVEAVLGGLATTHAADMASLMTLNFQEFGNVSLLGG